MHMVHYDGTEGAVKAGDAYVIDRVTTPRSWATNR
jgi:hypothetical protein